MVYKKYIKRGGKVFGPYYYESYRGVDGKVKTRYVGFEKNKKRGKKIKKVSKIKYLFFILGLIIGLVFAVLVFRMHGFAIIPMDSQSYNGGVEDFSDAYDDDFNSYALSKEGSIFYFNYSFGNMVGLKLNPSGGDYVVECFDGESYIDIESFNEEVEGNYSVPVSCQNDLQIKVSYFSEEFEEEINETEIEIEVNETDEVLGEINESEFVEEVEEEVNETGELVEEPEEVEEEEPEEVEEEEPEEVEEEEFESGITGGTILEFEGEFYEIVVYDVEGELSDLVDETISGNQSVEFGTLQYRAVVGRPVKWVQIVRVENRSEDIEIKIPRQAVDIVVKTGTEVDEAERAVEEYGGVVESADREDIVLGILTGQVSLEIRKSESIFKKIWRWLKSLVITGRVIFEDELQEEIVDLGDSRVVNVSDIMEQTNEEEVAVEYYTDAPQAVEEEIGGGKRITITGPDEVHYEDVLAYSELDNFISMNDSEKIRLMWYNEGGDRVRQEFGYYDLDEDGYIDYIEWIVPSLSEQVYEIIYITKAVRLDSNREFVEDVYDFVKEQDDDWVLINDGEYVRITFEVELDSGKDITLYVRSNSGGSVEVYEEGGEEIIAVFDNISSEDWYKIYLTELSGVQDVFDLRVLGEVEFDYIVDPAPLEYDASTNNFYTCGNITAAGHYTMNQSILGDELIPASSSGCINIYHDDVVFNCTGYTISNTSLAIAGIYSNSTNTTVRDCNITMSSSSYGWGIEFNNSNSSYIINNTLNSQSFGIIFYSTYYTQIVNNSILDNAGGIGFVSGDNNNITNNTVNSNSAYGINFASDNNHIADNTINSNPGDGIILSGINNTVENNIINSNGDEGIYLSDDSNNITSNTINSNGDEGIYLYSSSNNSLMNNTIYSNVGDGILVSTGSSENLIKENNVSSNADSGITIFSYSNNNQIINNTFNSNNIGVYTFFSADSNNVTNNTINSNTEYGVHVASGSSNIFSGNNLSGNGIGVFIEEGIGNIVVNNIYSGNSKDLLVDPRVVVELNVSNMTFEVVDSDVNISWTNPVSFYTTDLTAAITTGVNSIFVNSTNLSGLDASARLTIYNTNSLGFTVDRWPLLDGANCSSSICTEVSDADSYVFDVTGFSTYSVGGTAVGGDGDDGDDGGGGGSDCGVFNDWCDGADVNHDGWVNILDMIVVREHFGGGCSEENNWCDGYDFNHDGFVNILDMIYVRDNLGGESGGDVYGGIGGGGEVGDVELVELEVPMLSSEDGGCDSDFGCSEWGECKIDYNFEDLVLGVEKITGEQRRFCEDSADCVADRIQERKCSVVLGIYAEEKEWCEENYLWIYDKDTDELLGRIKNRKLEEIPSLDIEFLNSRPEFCDYCYNEIQDKDETGIDCGGSCEKCVDIFYSPSLFDDVMRWLGF